MQGDTSPRAMETCKRSLSQHMSQLEKDITNFKEMLESLREGEGKYIPTLKIQKDKLSTKCSQIANVIYELDSHSIN